MFTAIIILLGGFCFGYAISQLIKQGEILDMRAMLELAKESESAARKKAYDAFLRTRLANQHSGRLSTRISRQRRVIKNLRRRIEDLKIGTKVDISPATLKKLDAAVVQVVSH